MKLAIGVMGARRGELPEVTKQHAYRLGEAIAGRGAILITGGCPGLPCEAVRGAKARGGLVVGISPGLSVDEHREKYRPPVDGFDVLIYTGSGLIGRERRGDAGLAFDVSRGRSSYLGRWPISRDATGPNS